MPALITKRKRPSVTIVMGIVKMIRMGFTIALAMDNTSATSSA